MEEEKLITIEDMANVLQIKPGTMHSREWRKMSGCPLFRIRKRVYAYRSAFWKWVEQQGTKICS